MTLTKDMIDTLRFVQRMEIDATLETDLLRRFGQEPFPEMYSEQDLHEQVRKYVNCHTRETETDSADF